MSKFLHTAHAAGQGVYVALLAREGFSGATLFSKANKDFSKATLSKMLIVTSLRTSLKSGEAETYPLNLIHVVVIRILQLMRLWT